MIGVLLVLGLAAACGGSTPSVQNAGGSDALPVSLGYTAKPSATGNVTTYDLVVKRARWELLPGVTVEAVTYNGSVPGPTIVVKEGDTLRVTVKNELDQDTSIHWHGVHVPNDMDGVPGVTQAPIRPGETFTYEFVASHAGTFMYHPHINSVAQIDNGLYGLLIINPQKPDSPAFDRVFSMMLGAWNTGPGGASMSPGDHGARMGDMQMQIDAMRQQMGPMAGQMSGMMGMSMDSRIEQMGQVLEQTMAQMGQISGMTADSDMPMETIREQLDQTMRQMTELRDQMRDAAQEMAGSGMGMGDMGLGAMGDQLDAMMMQMMGMSAGMAGSGMAGPGMAMGGMNMDYNYFTINGKAYPATEPWTVREGDKVRVRLVNISNLVHPMHLHGMDFKVIAKDGEPVAPANQQWMNTLTVNPGETYDIAFIADNPGVWVFHCHELHHTENNGIEPGGLIQVIRYEGYQSYQAPAGSAEPTPMPSRMSGMEH